MRQVTFNCKWHPLLYFLHFSLDVLWYSHSSNQVQFRDKSKSENVWENKYKPEKCFKPKRSSYINTISSACVVHMFIIIIIIFPSCSSPRSSLCTQALDAFGKFTTITSTSWSFNLQCNRTASRVDIDFSHSQSKRVKCLSPKRCCCWASP